MNLKNFTLRLVIAVLMLLPKLGYSQTYEVTTLAGGTFHDGPALEAKFYNPSGTAVDGAGNVYVADAGNNRIRKISPAGVVTTLAGSGSYDYADGTGTAASFNYPTGVALDGSGNVYVADRENHRIRKISPAGVVTTLAGSGNYGFADGTGTAASFKNPFGVAVDGSGNVYVADQYNHRIRKISPAGVVTTLAGSGTSGFANGTGTAARFNYPSGVAVDGSGNVYVADQSNSRIRKISPDGVVTTLAGSGPDEFGTGGYADGTGTAASFFYPTGVAVDGSGNVYVADLYNHRIRKISPAGVVTTLAGSGTAGSANGTGTAASFNEPTGVAVDGSGNVFVVDQFNHRIRKISPAGVVTTLAGSGTAKFADGTGTAASFNEPYSVAVDGSGNVYVADIFNHRIRKISPAGVVTTLAGSGTSGFADGTGTAASFWNPTGVTVDGSGNVYVADSFNNRIRKISPAGVVTTIAGSGTATYADGTGTAASFNNPFGVAVDGFGNVYVADTYNHIIRKISPAGVVTTLAGSGTATFADGTGTAASFKNPYGVAVDNSGNVYVADTYNHIIRKISPAGVVTTLAGSVTGGYADGTGTAARFYYTSGVAVDGSGNVYVADKYNHRIRKISPAGVVTTLAGSGPVGYLNGGYADGTGTAASFWNPTGVTVDGSGNVYVADEYNNCIRKISPACTTPSSPTITGLSSFCAGSSTILTSSAATGNLWSTGETTQSITVSSAGNYTVRVIDGACTSGLSNEIAVTVNSMPATPTISSSNGISICSNETTTLSAGAASGYVWSNSANTSTITVGAGTYSVRTINASGCTSAVSGEVVITQLVCNQTFTGVGNINSNGNWSMGAAPASNTDITVDGVLTFNSNFSLRNITVNPNDTIKIPTGVTLTVTGNLANEGVITGLGTLLISGANNQSIGGGTISNLTVANSQTVVLSAATSIEGTLTLGDNTAFDLNNNALTLLSTATQTARLAAVPSGASLTAAGNFTVQRWLNPRNVRNALNGTGNYYYTGPIVQNQTVALWNTVSPYGPETFNQATPSGSRFYFFNSATNAWRKPTSLSQSLPVGIGAQVWFGTQAFFLGGRTTWSASGTPVVGNLNLPLTSGVAGFNLISNPYPSTIDWESASWTKTGVANAIYIYDWVNQRYRTYVNGIGTNGGNRYLPTAQGFFVNATSSSAVLTATEDIKVSNQVAMQRTESQVSSLVRMQVRRGSMTDEVVIAHRPNTQLAFEPQVDAQKMMNPATNIFIGGTVRQSIASMDLNAATVIPIELQSDSTGMVTVSTTEFAGLSGGTYYLVDEMTTEVYPYTPETTYQFYLNSNEPYSLSLRMNNVTSINTFKANEFEVYPNPATDKVTIKTTGSGTLEIVNVVGQVVLSQVASETNEINVSKLAKGVYTVKFNGNSQKLVVK